MKVYEVREVIDAAPQTIWSILTDAARYAEWNDTVERVEGTIAQGETIKVYATITPGRAFPVKVTTLRAPNRMVWRGGMPLGLFRGVRTFTLSGGSAGGSEFIMREEFSGLLAPVFLRFMPDLTGSFIAFAACLKRAAEAAAARAAASPTPSASGR